MSGLLFALVIAVVWVGVSALFAWWLARWVRRRDVRRQLDELKRNMEAFAEAFGEVLRPILQECATKLASLRSGTAREVTPN